MPARNLEREKPAEVNTDRNHDIWLPMPVIALVAFMLLSSPLTGNLLLDPEGPHLPFALTVEFGSKHYLTWRADVLEIRGLYPFHRGTDFGEPYLLPSLIARTLNFLSPQSLSFGTATGASVNLLIIFAAIVGFRFSRLLSYPPYMSIVGGLLAASIPLSAVLAGPTWPIFLGLPLSSAVALVAFYKTRAVRPLIWIALVPLLAVYTDYLTYIVSLGIAVFTLAVTANVPLPVTRKLSSFFLILAGLSLAALPLRGVAASHQITSVSAKPQFTPHKWEIHPRLLEILDRQGNNAPVAFIGPLAKGTPLNRALVLLEQKDSILDGVRRTVNSPFAIIPEPLAELLSQTESFPSQDSFVALSRFPLVRYLVYMGGDNVEHRSFVRDVKKNSRRIEILSRDRNGNYLLRHTPQLEAGEQSIFIPSVKDHKRILEFKIRARRSDQHSEPGRLVIESNEISENPSKRRFLDRITIDRDNRWRKVMIEIPQMSEAHLPLEIYFRELPAGSLTGRTEIHSSRNIQAPAFEIKELKLYDPWEAPGTV